MKVLELKNVQLASVNAKYGVNQRTGRLFLTPQYRLFKELVACMCKAVEIDPPYSVTIDIKTCMDIDNAIKPVLDGLQSAGIITDDKHISALHIYKTASKKGAPSDLTVYVETYGGDHVTI